jgi:hypothetical protein
MRNLFHSQKRKNENILNFQPINIFDEVDETFTQQSTQTHQQFLNHYFLTLNSETKQMINNDLFYFDNSSRSVPRILDPLNITCPNSREAYLISTNQLKADTQQKRLWEITSYQFLKHPNNEWSILTPNQAQAQKTTKEMLFLNHSHDIYYPERMNLTMKFSDLYSNSQNHQAIFIPKSEEEAINFTPAFSHTNYKSVPDKPNPLFLLCSTLREAYAKDTNQMNSYIRTKQGEAQTYTRWFNLKTYKDIQFKAGIPFKTKNDE